MSFSTLLALVTIGVVGIPSVLALWRQGRSVRAFQRAVHLRSGRISLRHAVSSDYEAAMATVDAEVVERMGWTGPKDSGIDAAIKRARWPNPHNLLIVEVDDEVAGVIAVGSDQRAIVGDRGSWNVGMWLGARARGSNHMSAALQLAVEGARRQHAVAIFADTDATNLAAIATLRRAGFTQVGGYRRVLPVGREVDALVFRILLAT